MGLKLKSTGGTGSVELNAPANHNIDTSFTLPTSNFTGGEWVLADGNGNVNIDSGTLYVDAVNDRVGIGTNAPGSLLELSTDATSAVGGITVDNTNAAGYSTLQLKNSGASGKTYTVSVGGNTSGLANKFYIYDDTAAATRFVVDSSGKVGIGTTSPALGSLHVNSGTNFALNLQNSSSNKSIIAFSKNSNGADARAWIEGNGELSGYLAFAAGDNERVRIDSSGRLIAGSTTSVNNECIFQTAGGDSIRDWAIKYTGTSGNAETGIRWLDKNNAVNAQISNSLQNDGVGQAAAHLVFKTATGGTLSERLRINSNGKYEFNPFGNGIYIYNFTNNAGNSTVKYNYSTGLLSYDTSSRLVKENIVDCPYGIEEIKQLQPRKYVRLDGGETEIGFIADEMHEVMPEFAPCGKKSILTKNEEDEEVIPLSVNYDKLTAVLTKALQEAIAKIETLEANNVSLEARLAALEGGTTP